MDRRHFLTIGEIESYINTSSSENEGEVVSAKRMKIVKPISKKITSVVYIPPADVDAVSDEEVPATDRFAKVRPLIDALNRKYMQFGVFETFLSIDEQMIPYFGRHSCKMFIRNKPIRFGFKYWALCSYSGYLYAVAPYGGSSVPYDKNVGLGASVVLSLLENVRNADNHAIYLDNFFSSYYLFCLLSEKRFRATGTVRSNRLRGAEKLLSTGKKLKKHQYDYYSEINNKLFVARWQDNAEVTVLSNFKSVDPLAVSQRWCKAEKKKVSVELPGLIHDYNQHMGGVDLHDIAVANYRVGIRGKKLWWPLWTNSVNSTTINAWKIHCLICKAEGTRHMSQISFKTEIAESLLLYCKEVSDEISDSSDIEEAERPVHLPRINVRDHVVWKPPGNKRKRCAMCHSQTVYECKKCNLRLHPKCFDEYHTDLGNKKK